MLVQYNIGALVVVVASTIDPISFLVQMYKYTYNVEASLELENGSHINPSSISLQKELNQ
jgi:hypothetical protein